MMVKWMQPIFDGFALSGIKVIGCTDGEYHHFGFSFPPSIELLVPMSKKALPNILLYFSNICDIYTTAYGDVDKVNMDDFSFYDYRLHNGDNISICLSMPAAILNSIHSKAAFKKYRKEFIDIVSLRLVLFQQKMESTVQ